jgi:hypothetical protein
VEGGEVPIVAPVILSSYCTSLTLLKSQKQSTCFFFRYRCEGDLAGVLDYWESARKKGSRKLSNLIFRATSHLRRIEISFDFLYC